MTETRPPVPGHRIIRVAGAREHNLKSVDVTIPRGLMTVVAGVSGSGKSSLAFDTVFAEGRRRYLETFSSYTRQFLGRMGRPAVTSIDGLSPAVAVDQSTVVGNPRSTVGTMTEVYDLLRLLWARFGTAPAGGPPPTRQLFSFNSPHGACPECRGLGVEDRLDAELLVADASRTIREGALRITTPTGYLIYSQVTIDVLDQVCRAHGFSVDVPWRDLTAEQRAVVLNGSDRIRIPYGKHPLESRMKWTGITARPREEGVYRGILPVMEQILRQKRNDNILRFVRTLPCRACGGTRLRPDALAVTYGGRSIAQAAAMSVSAVRLFADEGGAPEAAAVVLRHIRERCGVIDTLGLGYLSLDRASTSLSGGEAQRLRLARLAGLDLGGLLYVLDEPSIGLHPRDTARLLDVLDVIRRRGNTVLVVEHDEDTLARADWVVDVGPGAGPDGGTIVFSGPTDVFLAEPEREDRSRTRAFLTRRERLPVPASRRAGNGTLSVSGLSAHNLRHLDVTFLLGALNVVSGVSGAGKSTLVDETRRLVAAAPLEASEAGRPGEPSARTTLRIGKVISIDQGPIGRTPRSNAATYTGLFDLIRDRFAAEPEAVRRGFGKGRFSFNVSGGRCDTCEGAGVQQVGLQFMGDVSVTCDACGGSRFNDATLEVLHRGRSIHDVLALSIGEACEVFSDVPAMARHLETLRDLGLGYLPLGHPATMLSGGEAQRVKLATELAKPPAAHTLYVLDEPTTGLHPADVGHLLAALDGLVSRGHTVIVIEHHLDVIAAADRVIDLGPGSGDDGGTVVACGTPEAIAAADTATGLALRRHLEGAPPAAAPRREPTGDADAVRFTNVTTHNLRGIDASFPHRQLTVVTGVSGSGKSSLAFDTLFEEGRRRFAESLATYARRFVQRASDAEFDAVTGLTPTLAISQQAPSRNPRSTVGTLTEIHDACRLLFSRFGTRVCPACGTSLAGHTCPSCAYAGVQTLTSAMFSPNSDAGACAQCQGLGERLVCDPLALITHPDRPIADGAMDGHKTGRFYGDPAGQHMATLHAAALALGLDVSGVWRDLDPRAQQLALDGAGARTFDVAWSYKRGSRTGVHRFSGPWPGLLELVHREFDRKHADHRGDALASLMVATPCGACGGAGLREEARAVRFAGETIGALLGRSVEESLEYFQAIDTRQIAVDATALALSADLRSDVVRRLERLRDAGLGYLSLDRRATTLSGGEAQRVRLASQIRSGLTGITYVLDEPTVGLHARDTGALLSLLRQLRDEGNTVVVVEHDLDVIGSADHVIELGPGAGRDGGTIVAQGQPKALAATPASRTGAHLTQPVRLGGNRRDPKPGVRVREAFAHNLSALDVDIPAGALVAVTGVSGSGKSSLVFDVLAPSVAAIIDAGGRPAAPVGCRQVQVDEPFGRVVQVAGVAASTSPWSTPAAVVGMLDPLRGLFAATSGAQDRGLTKAHFSTAAAGGRCESCEGTGVTRLSMDFLPDVWSTCEDCEGRRFGPAVLACVAGGRTVADVLDMTAPDVRNWLASAGGSGRTTRAIERGLAALEDAGLGYLAVGQAVRTMSGGERQRLVLAEALVGAVGGRSLILMDEPTTGLHADDVERLLRVFDRLVDGGHTIVVVEHHLGVIAAADWIVDLGPEGGTGGGRLVTAGTPASVAACAASWTGRALAQATSRGVCS